LIVAVVELAGDDVEVVDYGGPPQVEQVRAGAAAAGAADLPVAATALTALVIAYQNIASWRRGQVTSGTSARLAGRYDGFS
jgi:hypothetical protein